jgi:hypothetical protein
MSLGIKDGELSAAFVCKGIFSANYLHQHFGKSGEFPTIEDVRPIYEKVKNRWLEEYAGLRTQKEAYTRTEFLDPVLKEIGWTFIPEKELPSKGVTRKRPDYCLFLNDEARQRAAKESDTADVFRESATVLEAKRVQHSLDEISGSETPGWFPSQQVQDYLRNAKDKTGQRYFNWAILTNGNEWRLYCEQAANDAYFAFHLAHEEEFCSLEDFCFFVALFRPQSFEQDEEQRCSLDKIREESLTRQAELESNLRKRIFDVLEDLANGFRDYPTNEITKQDFPALYDNSLIFLYRLLFGLYAESRGLLPVKPSGYGSSKIYREKFSLARLVKTLREKNSFSSEAFTDLYDDLLKLFRLINGDKPEQNEECKVTRYNGGLFNPSLHKQIEKWRVSDNALANVLRQLIFAQPPARSSARQQQISTDETIDYGLLEVRQLGDIYEGLLGAILEVNEKGRLELRNANGENHRHGIFYTPDWVVCYFIREALQPLIDEIESKPDVQAALKTKIEEKKRDNSFALAVLRLNLCDPAIRRIFLRTPAARKAGATRSKNAPVTWKTFTFTSPIWVFNCSAPAGGLASSFPTRFSRWRARRGCGSCCKRTASTSSASAIRLTPWLTPQFSLRAKPRRIFQRAARKHSLSKPARAKSPTANRPSRKKICRRSNPSAN